MLISEVCLVLLAIWVIVASIAWRYWAVRCKDAREELEQMRRDWKADVTRERKQTSRLDQVRAKIDCAIIELKKAKDL